MTMRQHLPYPLPGFESTCQHASTLAPITTVEGNCNKSYHQKLQRMASKCYLLMTPITLLLPIPTVGAIAVYGYATIDKGREERPPSPKRDGGHPPRGRPVPGHCRRPPCPSSPPAPGTPSRAQPPPLPPSSSSRPR